jgi:hypothetical protein
MLVKESAAPASVPSCGAKENRKIPWSALLFGPMLAHRKTRGNVGRQLKSFVKEEARKLPSTSTSTPLVFRSSAKNVKQHQVEDSVLCLYPEQFRTGSLGYFGNCGLLSESLHNKKVEFLADSITRA